MIYVFGILVFLSMYAMIVIERENDENNDENH